MKAESACAAFERVVLLICCIAAPSSGLQFIPTFQDKPDVSARATAATVEEAMYYGTIGLVIYAATAGLYFGICQRGGTGNRYATAWLLLNSLPLMVMFPQGWIVVSLVWLAAFRRKRSVGATHLR